MLLVDRELSVFIYWISLQPTPTSAQKKRKFLSSPLLSPFKRVYVALLLVKKQGQTLSNGLIIAPLSKSVLFIFYMNCSKYFSLKPVSGNLKSFCVPSIAV